MNPTTIALSAAAIGGGLWWYSTRTAPRGQSLGLGSGVGEDEPGPITGRTTQYAGRGPKWCDRPGIGPGATDKLWKAFQRVWRRKNLKRGQYENTADAKDKAFRVAMAVMRDTCPHLKRPSKRAQASNFGRRYGRSWKQIYETGFGWAYDRIVALPST